MAASETANTYDSADSIEKNIPQGSQSHHLERLTTVGGHKNDTTQPSMPVVHRRLANPSPLGLLSFATDIFLISIFGVKARGVATPNVLVGVLVFYGGVCQFIAGIFEFVAGNTFGATLFPSFAAFNISYAMIFLPGSGILAAYTDSATGMLNDQFAPALSFYIFAWFIMVMIFTVGGIRSSWVLFIDLCVLDLDLLLLAVGYYLNNDKLLIAANSLGFVVAFLTYWAGCAGLYVGLVPFTLPTFPMYKAD